jgi:predicted neuraminidase
MTRPVASGSLWALVLCVVALPLRAAGPPATAAGSAAPDADGFLPLFNGRDLAGWVPMNVAAGGRPDDTFTVRDGMIVSTGKPTGVMRTDRMYENFVVEMEWKHLEPAGNAGLFIWGDGVTAPGTPFARGIEVQILDEAYITRNPKVGEWATGQGDVFAIHGATMVPDRPHPKGAMRCLPSERRTKPAGEWNHYRVECVDGVLKLAVNGKVVSGATQCNPRKGYICLESEGAPAHFRNLRVKELPGSGAKPEETAKADPGYKSIYNGLDLTGWSQDPGHKGHWQPKDWTLAYDGNSEAKIKHLWTERSYGDFELVADWRLVDKPKRVRKPIVLPTGEIAKNDDGTEKTAEVDWAGEGGILLRGSDKAVVDMGGWPAGSGGVGGYRDDPSAAAAVRAGATPKAAADKKVGQWNRFVITMKGDRLTVVLNNQTVIADAHLPGVKSSGPIGLQDRGAAIEFANLFVRELGDGHPPAAESATKPAAGGLPGATADKAGSVLLSEFVYDQAPFPSVHATTIAATKDGGFASAFFGGTAEGNKDVCIWVSRKPASKEAGAAGDGGEGAVGWTPPEKVAAGSAADGKPLPCWNPVLHAMPDGSLLLFYKVGPKPNNWWGMLTESADGGRTWSPPRRLPDGILGPVKNKAIALTDGTLLCPSSTEDAGWRVHMEFTRDGGKTFTRTDALNDGKAFGLIQPTVLTHDGKLIALCRSRGLGKVVALSSADQGKTWSAPTPTDLPNPNSGIDGVTLADGRSVLVYNHTAKGRSPLNVAVSPDGKAWTPSVVLESEPGEYSYPAVVQSADGLVHVTYTWKRQKVRHVVLDPRRL